MDGREHLQNTESEEQEPLRGHVERRSASSSGGGELRRTETISYARLPIPNDQSSTLSGYSGNPAARGESPYVRRIWTPELDSNMCSGEEFSDEDGDLDTVSGADVIEEIRSLHFSKGYLAGIADGSLALDRSFMPPSRVGGSRYILGVEFAISAIIAMAGIARRRGDLSAAALRAITENDRRRTPRVSEETGNGYEGLDSEFLTIPGLSELDSARLHRSMERLAVVLAEQIDGASEDSLDPEQNYLLGSVLHRPTVLVTLSDTLVSIAERHYHDEMLAWLIADLNLNKMRERWSGKRRVLEIQNGQMLELPVWEDIVEFYQHRPKDAKPENLETIVLTRSIDRDHLASALASVVDGAAPHSAFSGTCYIATMNGYSIKAALFAPDEFYGWMVIRSCLNIYGLERKLCSR